MTPGRLNNSHGTDRLWTRCPDYSFQKFSPEGDYPYPSGSSGLPFTERPGLFSKFILTWLKKGKILAKVLIKRDE